MVVVISAWKTRVRSGAMAEASNASLNGRGCPTMVRDDAHAPSPSADRRLWAFALEVPDLVSLPLATPGSTGGRNRERATPVRRYPSIDFRQISSSLSRPNDRPAGTGAKYVRHNEGSEPLPISPRGERSTALNERCDAAWRAAHAEQDETLGATTPNQSNSASRTLSSPDKRHPARPDCGDRLHETRNLEIMARVWWDPRIWSSLEHAATLIGCRLMRRIRCSGRGWVRRQG